MARPRGASPRFSDDVEVAEAPLTLDFDPSYRQAPSPRASGPPSRSSSQGKLEYNAASSTAASMVEAGMASMWLENLQDNKMTRGGTGSFNLEEAGDQSHGVSSLGTVDTGLTDSTRRDTLFTRPQEHQPMDLGSIVGSEASDLDAEAIRELIFEKMHGDPLLCIPAQEHADGQDHQTAETHIEAMMKFYGLHETKAETRRRLKKTRLADLTMKYKVRNDLKKSKKKKRGRKGLQLDEEEHDDLYDDLAGHLGGEDSSRPSKVWMSEMVENSSAFHSSQHGSQKVLRMDPVAEEERGALPEIHVPDPRALVEFMWCLFKSYAIDLNSNMGFRFFAWISYIANAVSLGVQAALHPTWKPVTEVSLADQIFAVIFVVVWLIRIEGRTGSVKNQRGLILDGLLIVPAAIHVLISRLEGKDENMYTIFPVTIFLIWHVFETWRFRTWWILKMLRIMMKTLRHGAAAMFWGFVVLCVFSYAFSLVVRQLLRDQDVSDIPGFATMPNTMLSFGNIVLGGNWAVLQAWPVRESEQKRDIAFVVYSYVCVVRLVVYTFIVGSFIDLAVAAGLYDRYHVEQEKLLRSLHLPQIKRDLEDIDVNGNGFLSWAELWYGLKAKPNLKQMLDLSFDRAALMFKDLDVNGTGEVHVEDILHAHIKRKGASTSLDSMLMDRMLRLIQSEVTMRPGMLSGLGNKIRTLERRMTKQAKMLRQMRYIIQLQIKRIDTKMSRLEMKFADIQRVFMTPAELARSGTDAHEGGKAIAGYLLHSEMEELKEVAQAFLESQLGLQEARAKHQQDTRMLNLKHPDLSRQNIDKDEDDAELDEV